MCGMLIHFKTVLVAACWLAIRSIFSSACMLFIPNILFLRTLNELNTYKWPWPQSWWRPSSVPSTCCCCSDIEKQLAVHFTFFLLNWRSVHKEYAILIYFTVHWIWIMLTLEYLINEISFISMKWFCILTLSERWHWQIISQQNMNMTAAMITLWNFISSI